MGGRDPNRGMRVFRAVFGTMPTRRHNCGHPSCVAGPPSRARVKTPRRAKYLGAKYTLHGGAQRGVSWGGREGAKGAL